MDSKFTVLDDDLLLDVTNLRTYCRGDRSVFKFGRSSDLVEFKLKKRFKVNQTTRTCLFLQSTCMVRLGHLCEGVVIAIQMKKNHPWKFGVVQALFNKRLDGEDLLHYFELVGDVDDEYVPFCFECTNWELMYQKQHFQKKEVQCNQIYAFHMLNQIAGKTPCDFAIQQNVINTIDGGMQSSKYGPDKWTVPSFPFQKQMSIKFDDHPVSCIETGSEDVLYKRKHKSRHASSKNTETTPLTKWRVKDDATCLVLVSTSPSNKPIQSEYASKIPNGLEKTINFGSITSCESTDSLHQDFFCLKENVYDQLIKEYPEGLPLSENVAPAYQIDKLLKERAAATIKLISVDKLGKKVDHSYSHNGFVQIFAGEGSPDVDDTFNSVDVHGADIRVHYKIAKGVEFQDYVPLSISIFQSTFHGMKILPSFASRLLKAFGSRGLFPSRSFVNKGSQSYIGERKSNRLSQPTVSEGPSERKNVSSDEPAFVYYRNKVKALQWPFVLSFMNFLVNKISIAPYYFYHHLSKYYPHKNDMKATIRFCTIAILTINFCCSCHVDQNDRKPCLFEAVTDDMLSNELLPWMKYSLAHLYWWGLSIPTSCCYQYIKERNDIEIYQWFMCPGLGTTYRIKNYWVHIMLAGLFSHCTSCAIYVVDNKAYFGFCPDVTMFAWGGA